MYSKLRRKRKAQRLTCDYMAKHLGYANRSVYNKKERGLIPIRIDEAIKISKLLKVKIEDIFL